MDWEAATAFGTLTTINDGAFYSLLPSTPNTFYTDPTLMFTAIDWSVLVPASPGTNLGVSIGIIRWDDANDNVPAGAEIPSPITQADFDWIYLVNIGGVNSGAAFQYFPDGALRHSCSKAKRRLGSNSGLLCVIENRTSVTISYNINIRHLIKE